MNNATEYITLLPRFSDTTFRSIFLSILNYKFDASLLQLLRIKFVSRTVAYVTRTIGRFKIDATQENRSFDKLQKGIEWMAIAT